MREVVERLMSPGEISWLPDSKHVAYVSQGDIFVVNIEGIRSAKQLDISQEATRIAWSPDGSQFIYAVADQSAHALVIALPDGKTVQQIPVLNKVEFIAWTPDGKRALFTTSTELFTMDRDGTNIRKVSFTAPEGHHITQPSWSPDGTRILFSTASCGLSMTWEPCNTTLNVVNADGTGLREVSKNGYYYARWEPVRSVSAPNPSES